MPVRAEVECAAAEGEVGGRWGLPVLREQLLRLADGTAFFVEAEVGERGFDVAWQIFTRAWKNLSRNVFVSTATPLSPASNSPFEGRRSRSRV